MAPLFAVVVAATGPTVVETGREVEGAVSIAVELEPVVEVSEELEIPVAFSWKIPGRRTTADDEDELAEDVDKVAENVEVEVLLVEEVVGVGVGVGDDEDDGGGAAAEELELEPLAEEPSRLKTLIFATAPWGIVATQNAEPPAPSAASLLITVPSGDVEGSILQGRPLQSTPGSQTISRPNVGGVANRGEAWKTGL